LTRWLATWSFALLVIGAAIVDATILAKEPKRQQANVEVVPAEPLARSASAHRDDRILETTPADVDPDLTAPVIDPFQRIRLLGPNDPRPQNRFEVNGLMWTVTHQARDGGMPIELRAPKGCTITVDGQSAKERLRAFFPDGDYTVWSSCAGDATRISVRQDQTAPRP
jgi:hypothetical protein